jgi:hypothetical protein
LRSLHRRELDDDDFSLGRGSLQNMSVSNTRKVAPTVLGNGRGCEATILVSDLLVKNFALWPGPNTRTSRRYASEKMPHP